MAPNHQQYIQWNGDWFRKWAAKIGQSTVTAIFAILEGYRVEQQGYKACMGLLKLADNTSEHLENACRKALSLRPRPSFKNIQAGLSSGQNRISDESGKTADSSSKYGFTRGADYYGRNK